MSLSRQMSSFVIVGLMSAVVHYGVLVGLVEWGGAAPVPATLAGYVFGGATSYALNRRHTFASDRAHREAAWRFAAVAFVGFLITFALMHLLVDRLRLPYLPAQLGTTGIVLFWSFLANKLWTFKTS